MHAPRRWFAIILAGFAALSAIGGGIEMVVWPTGNAYLPIELLAPTVFDSFLVPGLVLALVVGGSCLVAAVLEVRRAHAALDGTMLAGAILAGWIAVEMAMLREVHWLHAIYGGIGACLLALGIRNAWRLGSLRHRWTIVVTAMEALGFLAPALAGLFAHRVGLSPLAGGALVVAGGFVEGLALGTGQAVVFPLPVRRLRYAMLTSLGAGLVWTVAMTAMGLADTSPAVAALVMVPAGALGLLAIGTAQWLELRHHISGARRWIGWTALAWALGLPLSFAPGPFVDEATPLSSHVVMWAAGGLLMAYVMASITWLGVRRLVPDATR